MKVVASLLLASGAMCAHDVITTPITWTREISRIVLKKCSGCHTAKGPAFPLTTYQEVRPWIVAIREEVLRRTMPPWGAVKGFGDFSNDTSLTPEEIELILKWSDGGVPEGEEKDLPKNAEVLVTPRISTKGQLAVSGTTRLQREFTLGALLPKKVPDGASLQITAELPDGSIEPILWLKDYREQFAHPFLLRNPLRLPAGTTLRGAPSNAVILFLPPPAARK